jgi:hypothetical protein
VGPLRRRATNAEARPSPLQGALLSTRYRAELRFRQPPAPCRGSCSRGLPPRPATGSRAHDRSLPRSGDASCGTGRTRTPTGTGDDAGPSPRLSETLRVCCVPRAGSRTSALGPTVARDPMLCSGRGGAWRHEDESGASSPDNRYGRTGSVADAVARTLAPPRRCGSGWRASGALGRRPKQASQAPERRRPLAARRSSAWRPDPGPRSAAHSHGSGSDGVAAACSNRAQRGRGRPAPASGPSRRGQVPRRGRAG